MISETALSPEAFLNAKILKLTVSNMYTDGRRVALKFVLSPETAFL